MNADLLLRHFSRISEAPDAVARLRRFILDLAVRGKLVEQDPKDEPAAKLLKRIQVEKAKRGTALSSIVSDELSFALPLSWSAARFGDVYSLEYGDNLPARKRSNTGEYPVYGSNGVVGSHSECFVSSPCIVVGRKGSAGALNLSLNNGCCVTDVAYYCIPPIGMDISFSFKLFQTLELDGLGKGIKPGLNRNDAYALPIAIPPLAEQHRIVTKVDELMALCDQLEAAKNEREARRDRLVAASLNRIGTAPVDELSQAARFHLAHLPRLSTRVEHVNELRQTILNLAVRGKLVPQDPKDEPSAELFKRIQEDKTRLLKEGKAEKAKAEIAIADGHIPYVVPTGWKWVRLGQICAKTGSGSTPRGGKEAYVNSGVPFLRSQNVYDDGLRLSSVAFISDEIHQRMSGTAVIAGDLLLNITGGSIGRCAIVPDDFQKGNVSQHVAILRMVLQEVNTFIHLIVISPYFQNEIVRSQTGAGREGLPKNRMDEIAVPLPPLAEQQRIVAKVDELMTLCDKLETQLTITQTGSGRLLEAVLSDTLAPALAA